MAAVVILSLVGCSAVSAAIVPSPDGASKSGAPATAPVASPTATGVDYGPTCQRWVDFNAAQGTTQDQVPALYAPLTQAIHPACVIRTGTVYELLFDQNMAGVLKQLVAAGWEDRNGSSALLMVGQCQLSIVMLTDGPNFTGTWSEVFGSDDPAKFSLWMLGAPLHC